MVITYFLAFNPLISKLTYRFQTHLVARDDVVFLNVGYEEDPPMALDLSASDEPNRFHIQLYHSTASQADLTGKRVLEVGCGHGGGASYLTRTMQPSSYTALDLNVAGIGFCQQRHQVPGLDFVQGNAEDLPFDDESFDVVLNIESSGAYPHFARFLSEVTRVLRPGGDFLYADLRPTNGIADWETALACTPMKMVSKRIINTEVLLGMDQNTQKLEDLVAGLPRPLRLIGREYAASKGSGFYRALQRDKFSFRMYCFEKPSTTT